MSQILDSVFEFLFKYRPLVYSQGDFGFTAPRSVTALVLFALLVAIPLSLTYAWVRAESQRRDRILLATSRVALLAILGFCLLRPSLSISSLMPQRGYVAVLVDDSRSMRVRDDGTEPRAAALREWFGQNSELKQRLESRFRVRYYRFAENAELTTSIDSLQQSGSTTNLAGALADVTQDMSGLPLSGVVLVSDGADNSQGDLSSSLLALRAGGVPIFAIGVGSEAIANDVQVTRVALPNSVLKGASVLADVELRHAGYGGERVRVEVEDAGRLLAREEVELPRNSEFANVRIPFTASESGARQLRVRVAPPAGESLRQNNEREALLVVRGGREKILYVEGEPRFELKFIRRALADENNLQLVVLQRTAPEKFLRLDVDDASELADGFPKTRAELFKYRALVLGSIEASFFTHEQLEMIADFVSKRGGGLLMLGGARSFSEGGWSGTPVAEVLPVELERRDPEARRFVQFRAQPTRAGAGHPLTRLAESANASVERWRTLPAVSTANLVTRLKPGATALLTGDETSNGQILLAHQRYGRGTASAFTAQDSWLWQMHADIAVDDLTHETFWRQLMRFVVQDVAEPLRLHAPPVASAGQTVAITANVEDSAYTPINDATVSARIIQPNGEERTVPLNWSGASDGEFKGALVLQQPGLHEVTLAATRGEQLIGESKTFLRASSADVEFFDPQMRPSTLRRAAEETGGRFYTKASIATLPDDISYLGQGETLTELKDLWDMPFVFVLIVGLLSVEWLYRRRKGLI